MKYNAGPSAILPDGPHYNIKAHLTYVQNLWNDYPWRDKHVCVEKVVSLIDDDVPESLGEDAAEFLAVLFQENDIFIPHKPTLEYTPYLTYIQKRLTQNHDAAFRAAQHFLRPLYRFVSQGAGAFTIPFYDLFTATQVIGTCWQLYQEEHQGQALFPDTRGKLTANLIKASGYNPSTYEGKGKLVQPSESKLGSEEKLLAYLHDTPFLKFFATPVPFAIPRKTFASHGIILAPPNHGKTQLLGSIIADFITEPDPVGVVLLDPHGDLFNTLRLRVDPTRLIVLDPDTSPPALNFLDFGTSTQTETLQTFSYLMSSLSGGLTDKQGAIVPYLLKLLRQIPDASLETLRLVVDEKVKKVEQSQFATAIQALPIVDQGFFHNQFYSTPMQITKDAIGWKLYSALASDAFREMFSAKTNSFSADDAMRERKVVLVKGARASLGDHGMQVFLQFIVAQFFSAALRRDKIPVTARHLCVLCADEAHHIFNSQTANILTECRKYGLGFLAATQVVQQIPEDVKAAIYGATAIKIAGPVSHNDAMILAREMYTTGDFIRSMKARERQGADFAVHVSGLTNQALKLSIPYGTLEALPTRTLPPQRQPPQTRAQTPPQSPPPSHDPSKPAKW